MGDVNLEALFDEIIEKTEKREAFSEVKERNMGFSAIADMKALRSEFIASKTELELLYALSKLSNARRDRHLGVWLIDGGLTGLTGRGCESAPIRVLPEILDVNNPNFFVASVEEGFTSPQVGDVIISVNGQTIREYIDEFDLYLGNSTLPLLYWDIARYLPRRIAIIPLTAYTDRLYLTLERPSGQRYDVALTYRDYCPDFSPILRLTDPYARFEIVMERENFRLRLDRNSEVILLDWRDFETDYLLQDIDALMMYAEEEQILDWDMVIDVTYSGGGSWGAFVIQRLSDKPFRTTFGNVRISDLGRERIERYIGRSPLEGQPEIFGLNLSRSWLIDWAETDAAEAIRNGDEYTNPVPFKLAHLPKDSDGILQPAPLHFTGEIVVTNARTRGGSHLDQFVAMLVDNDLATFIGVPTGGFSNTWEGDEVLYFPGTTRPVAEFMWSIGHTIRPNGEVLEGNPAEPHKYIPITRENYRDYHKMLLDEAIKALGR